MGILIDIIIGLIHGLGGPDLKSWVDDLPSELGTTIGKIVKQNLVDGQLTEDGIKSIESWLRINEKEISRIISSLLSPRAAKDSLIPYYTRALNIVVETIRQTGRSLVLRGFLHDTDCLTYWEYNTRLGSVLETFRKSTDFESIHVPFGLKIHVLKEKWSESQLQELNMKIRKQGRLDYADYSSSNEVNLINEFTVMLDLFKEVEIPLGAPGIITMITSLSDATTIQGVPSEMLSKTIAKALKQKL
jgi:hypothetical protein